MSNFSAIIPAANMDAANAALGDLGFGYGNFSIPTKTAGATGADFAGLHCWPDVAFRAAVAALDPAYGVVITDGTGAPNFPAAAAKQSLTWVQATGAGDPNTRAKDAIVEDGGKTWVSLIDNNVWKPPVGWREVVATGNPTWVQPTGAHDAYALGAKVLFNDANYESRISANVWSPAAYPAGWRAI
jgi:hypothetical protein